MIHGIAPEGIIYIIYYRKSNRHKWLLCGQAREKSDFVRQLYYAQKSAPGWQTGLVMQNHPGGSRDLEDSLTQNAEVENMPDITDYFEKLKVFFETGTVGLSPRLLSVMIALHLLES